MNSINEMYSIGIVTHYYSVLAVLGVIFVNYVKLIKADEIEPYKRFNSIFNPMGNIFIGAVIFTGVVMMAAKHLDFTIENIVMIFVAIYVIWLEVKRSVGLKLIKNDDYDGFLKYKNRIKNLLLVQVLSIVAISVWMLVL